MTVALRNKQLVWAYWNKLVGVKRANLRDVLAEYNASDVDWSGGHPINDLSGVDALASGFWEPLLHAVPDLVRRTDILMGNTWGGHDFVTGTGYFVGTFVNDWLGIPATDETIYIRFGAFHRIENGKITQTRILFDLPDVMRQVGFQVLAPSLGDEIVVPGPAADDGVLLHEPDLAETVKTQTLVEGMIRGLQAYDGKLLESQGMPAFWTEDMKWYGPLGHGTYYTLHDFIYVYEDAFFTGLQPTQFGGVERIAFFSDGLYSSVCGWPSIRAIQGGPYLGAPPSGKEINMRVMDWWRRRDDLLAENWVFIDVPHVFKQLGFDLFERMNQSRQTQRAAAPINVSSAAGEATKLAVYENAMAFFDACETGQGWDACKGWCHDGATFSCQADALADITTLNAYTEWMKGLATPIPDMRYVIKASAMDNARSSVSVFAVLHGTQTGAGGPVPPTGNSITAEYVYVMEFEEDKIRHMTKIWNDAHSLKQLGWA